MTVRIEILPGTVIGEAAAMAVKMAKAPSVDEVEFEFNGVLMSVRDSDSVSDICRGFFITHGNLSIGGPTKWSSKDDCRQKVSVATKEVATASTDLEPECHCKRLSIGHEPDCAWLAWKNRS